MPFSAILATTKDGVFGTTDGHLPWNSAAEMHHFAAKTKGKTVVLGRNTWNPLYFPLKDRKHVVLSKTMEPNEDRKVYKTLDTLLRDLDGPEEVMVIGGGQIYDLFIFAGLVDVIHMSIMDDGTRLQGETTQLPFQFQIAQGMVQFQNAEKSVLYKIESLVEKSGFTYYKLKFHNLEEQQIMEKYWQLCYGIHTYESDSAVHIFGAHMQFDIGRLIPAVRFGGCQEAIEEALTYVKNRLQEAISEVRNTWKTTISLPGETRQLVVRGDYLDLHTSFQEIKLTDSAFVSRLAIFLHAASHAAELSPGRLYINIDILSATAEEIAELKPQVEYECTGVFSRLYFKEGAPLDINKLQAEHLRLC